MITRLLRFAGRKPLSRPLAEANRKRRQERAKREKAEGKEHAAADAA